MSVPMASRKKNMNGLFGTLLVLSALLSTASAIDCHGKSFHCVNSTHFMICVDLGGGVSQAIDDFYIGCPPPTVCQGTNHFECEFPAPTTPSTIRSNVISETTLPWEIITSSSLDNKTKEFSENYINTERATTVQYSVTTDTTVDVPTRTASNFYINNELNVTEIAPTIVADITTSPMETISQTISEDRSITETILTAEGVTTSVIESVTETTAETNNPTKTDLVIAGEENNKKAINMNTQTTTENIVITETEIAESVPITTEQIIQTTTDNPLEVDTSYLYTQLPQVFTIIQNENVTNNTLSKKSSAKKNNSLAMENQNINISDKRVDKHSTDVYHGFTTVPSMDNQYNLLLSTEAINIPFSNSDGQQVTTYAPSLTQSFADTTILDGAFTIETVENAPSSEQPTTVNLTKDSAQNIVTVNLDIVTTEAVNIPFSNSDVQLVMPQAPSLTQSPADTKTVDEASTIETAEKVPTSEHPTTIYEENFTMDTTQNIGTGNLDIVTTEAINIPLSNSDGQQVTTYAPSLTQSFADTTILDGAFTIETIENAPSSEQPTTVNEENLTKDSTQNIETVNLDIVTTEAVNIPFSNSGVQLVTTQAPSLTQSSADTNTVDEAYTIETAEKVPTSEHPSTIYEENLTKDSTQNIETVNLDIVTTEAVNIPFSNSHGQQVTTYAPSLTQSSAGTTILDEAFTIESVENAPSSEQPTTVNEEKLIKNSTQNIETVNNDIVTTEAANIAFSNSDDKLVMTQAPSLSQNLANTTTVDGAYTTETVESASSSKHPTTIQEENFTKDTTQNIETVNLDIITTEAINIPFSNSDGQQATTYAPSLSQNFADTTTLDGAFTIEIVESASSSELPTTANEEKFTKDSTQNIETVNLDIATTEAVNIPFSYSDVQLVTTEALSLAQSSADTTTVDGAFTIKTVENAPSSEQPTTLNVDIVITEAVNIPFSNGDDQLVMTQAPSLTKSPADTNLDRVTIETVEDNFITEQPKPQNSEYVKHEVEGQDQTANINWNPSDNYLIDKSNQNSELAGKSDVTNPNIERNDVNVVSSDTEFVSQSHIISALPVTNPIPLEINNRKQSYNATTVTQSSDGFLIKNGLPETTINVNSEHEVASLPTSEPVTLVKDNSIYLKTNTLASGVSVALSSSKTVPTNKNVAGNTVPDNKGHYVETVPNLLGPGSESTVDETGSSVKKIGSNVNVFSDTKKVDNSKNSKDITIADTTILDNTHIIETTHTLFSPVLESTVHEIDSNIREIGSNFNVFSHKTEPANPKNTDATVVHTKILDNTNNNEIIPILLSPGPESTVDETGSKVRQIESNVNVSSDNKKVENPKNSKGPITVDLSKTKNNKLNAKLTPTVQNDKIELQTNTHDLSETINMRITTEGDHKGMEEPSKPVMLDILPLPINNVKLRPSVTNIPLLTDATAKTQNGNIVLTTESYQSATFYPTLVNTPIQASVNGVHNTNTPTNLPTFDIQAEFTDKVISSKNSTFGGSTTVADFINRADVSPPHPLRVGQVSIGQTNIPENVYTISAKEQNVNETNYPQTSNATENEPQKNNSPINLSLSISTKKPYANTVQILSQSVTPNPISPVTKQVANEVAMSFTCANGIRGRYSDKDDCRKFYICFGVNQPVVGNCPENTVFSDINKLCTKNLSHCIRQDEFKCPSAGRFSDFMKDNVYYICVNHKDHLYRFKFQCQNGFIFNKTTVKCIESKEIESNESASISSSDNSIGSTSTASINNNSVSTSRISNNSSSDDSSSKTDSVSINKNTNEEEETREKSEGNEDDEEEDEVFKCKKEGKFPIRNECRRFYLCKKKRRSEYRRKIKKCGSGRVFHKDKKKCVDADSYEC
ncbi:fap1 adhesin-like [Cydia amplana]|uniref:fap1 adhesin-like n=1 Tax=Cydia amplana TaxID=1869771 RepID=UPI002FE56518